MKLILGIDNLYIVDVPTNASDEDIKASLRAAVLAQLDDLDFEIIEDITE